MMQLFLQGGLIAACTMAAYHIGLCQGNAALASTMAFATLTAARLFHGFNCRSDHSIFRIGFKSNTSSVGAFAVGMVFLLLVMFVPILRRLFSVSVLNMTQIGIVFGLAIVPTVVIQLIKVVREHMK